MPKSIPAALHLAPGSKVGPGGVARMLLDRRQDAEPVDSLGNEGGQQNIRLLRQADDLAFTRKHPCRL
jgi:hypothetical protein